mgnify:CR=1 FL=1
MKELKSYAKIWQVILCLALCFLSLIPHLITSDISLIEYPLEDLSYCDAYIQQFDAFKKKQIYIDIEPEQDLLELENPYDWDQRKEKGVFYLWDRALYNGKYYSYFGIAPIITIYAPFFAVSGHLPTPTITCFILAVIGIIAIFYAYYNLLRFFKIHPPSYIFLAGLLAVEFASLLPMLFSSADMYYIASCSAVTNLALFFAFFYEAMLKSILKTRNIFFILASLSFSFLLLSRPGLCLFGIIILPCLISVFFTKKTKLKKKISSFICLALPLGLTVIFTEIYNYMRFDSVFEFGARYQLTVYDVSEYSLTPALILPCLITYFLQLPRIKSSFPFIELDLANMHIPTDYLYRTSTIGAFAFPSNWGFFVIASVLSKPKRKYLIQKFTYLLFFISIAVLAFIDICMGGVNIRYFADISFAMILLTSLILAEIPSFFSESKKVVRAIVKIIIVLLLLSSAFLGFLLIFENERNYILTAIVELKNMSAAGF